MRAQSITAPCPIVDDGVTGRPKTYIGSPQARLFDAPALGACYVGRFSFLTVRDQSWSFDLCGAFAMRDGRPPLLLGYFGDRAACYHKPKSWRDFNKACLTRRDANGRGSGILSTATAHVVVARLNVYPKVVIWSELAEHPLTYRGV
jgi:hypothetical protein